MRNRRACWHPLKRSIYFPSSCFLFFLFWFFMPDSEIQQSIPTRNINTINRMLESNKKAHKIFDSISSITIQSTTMSKRETSTTNKINGWNGIILASWFTYQDDPQRGQKASQDIEYIWNFYTSSQFLGLNVVIFHDHLTRDFVSKYTTETISFQLIIPSKSFSTNDLRFIIYDDFLKKNPYEWILMTDASDVFFNRNPIAQISQNKENTSLFLSPDSGTFGKIDNGDGFWMINKMIECLPGRSKSWVHEWGLKIFNAGVWGGHKTVVSCILNCISNVITRQLKGRGNCNMVVVNYCIRFGNCASKTDLEIDNVKRFFVNPFREDCRNTSYSIVHNKCYDTEDSLCAIIRDGRMEFEIGERWKCPFITE